VAGRRQGIGQTGGVVAGVGVHRESMPPGRLQDGPGCVDHAPLGITTLDSDRSLVPVLQRLGGLEAPGHGKSTYPVYR
jgi:hypothetical protein